MKSLTAQTTSSDAPPRTKIVPPTRWEIAFALFALATGIYFLLDAGSWAAASRFVRVLLVASAGALFLLCFKLLAISAMKRREKSPAQRPAQD